MPFKNGYSMHGKAISWYIWLVNYVNLETRYNFLKDGHFPASFFVVSSFKMSVTSQNQQIKFADAGMRTLDLWCLKSHHH